MKNAFLAPLSLLLCCAAVSAQDRRLSSDEIRGLYRPDTGFFTRYVKIEPEAVDRIKIIIQSDSMRLEKSTYYGHNYAFFMEKGCNFPVRFSNGDTLTIDEAGDNCRMAGVLPWSAFISDTYKKLLATSSEETLGIYKISNSFFTGTARIGPVPLMGDNALRLTVRHKGKDGRAVVFDEYGQLDSATSTAIFGSSACVATVAFNRAEDFGVKGIFLTFGKGWCAQALNMGADAWTAQKLYYTKKANIAPPQKPQTPAQEPQTEPLTENKKLRKADGGMVYPFGGGAK